MTSSAGGRLDTENLLNGEEQSVQTRRQYDWCSTSSTETQLCNRFNLEKDTEISYRRLAFTGG